jgi:twinkle protein
MNFSPVPLSFGDIPARKLNAKTCEFWGYGTGEWKGQKVQVANCFAPDGSLVAQKVRTRNKDFSLLGDFSRLGLYGQHLWKAADNRKLVVVEGELDALSVSQVQELKWPVVSVPNGAPAAAKAIRKELEWVEKFKEVVFLLDNDEEGRKAAKECAELLSPGKALIGHLPLKDANEMLVAGRGKELISAVFDAKPYRPDGIISGTDLWERVLHPKNTKGISYPWPQVTAATLGCRLGEIVLVGAGTGAGKSEFVRQSALHFHDKHKETIGYVALEESVERSALGFVGMRLGKRLHVAGSVLDSGELRTAFESSVGSGRMFLYDHWGSCGSENLISRLRYLIRGCGCTTIVLDHISIVVSGIEDGDERRILDNTMTRLRSLVEETQVRMLVVAHLKSIEGTPHEEGARVTINHFRGSKSMTQISDVVIGLERDQQDRGSPTTMRILKHRPAGEKVGECAYLEYDTDSGLLIPSTKDAKEVKGAFDGEGY